MQLDFGDLTGGAMISTWCISITNSMCLHAGGDGSGDGESVMDYVQIMTTWKCN